MPQRQFWTERHPVEVRWRWWCDPLDPDADGNLSITVYDQAGAMMEHATVQVDAQRTHELVTDALTESWAGYLFGERHDGPRALKLVASRYWRARVARLTRSLSEGN